MEISSGNRKRVMKAQLSGKSSIKLVHGDSTEILRRGGEALNVPKAHMHGPCTVCTKTCNMTLLTHKAKNKY
jgi:hypothetical protein